MRIQRFWGVDIGPARTGRLCYHNLCFMLLLSSPPALVSRMRGACLQPSPFSALSDLQSFVHLILMPCVGLLVSTERPYFHGSGGIWIPTPVNLCPPPSLPGCHLLFGPLTTCRWTSQPGSSLTLPGLHHGSHMLPACPSVAARWRWTPWSILLWAHYFMFWYGCLLDCDLQMGTSIELYIEKWEHAYCECAHNLSRIQSQVTTSTFSTFCLSSTKAIWTIQPHSQQLWSVLDIRNAGEADFRLIKCDIQKSQNGKRIL